MSDVKLENVSFEFNENFSVNYDDEQLLAIANGLKEWEKLKSCRWMFTSNNSRIFNKGNQTFVQFDGTTAYELLPFRTLHDEDTVNGSSFEYVPIIVDGKMFSQFPEEGSGGILYLMRCLRRRGKWLDSPSWAVTDMSLGWIRGSEIESTGIEIFENIVAEIESGENVISRKPAGWA